jgi:RND superfamily putative drug exporter
MSARLREEFMNGYSAKESARIAIANDAPIVAAAGILIAGFVMAPVLIPALSTIEGHAFWWPRHARPPGRRAPEPGTEPPAEPEAALAAVVPSRGSPDSQSQG